MKHRPRPQRGMAWLLLLFALSALGLLLAEFGRSWASTAQRERETELLFIGQQFAQALASYAAQSPQGTPTAPEKLDDLLHDRRFPFPVRHLREIPRDPMTRSREWGLVRQGGRILAIHSQSDRQALRTARLPAWLNAPADPSSATRYAQWQFVATPGHTPTTQQAPSND